MLAVVVEIKAVQDDALLALNQLGKRNAGRLGNCSRRQEATAQTEVERGGGDEKVVRQLVQLEVEERAAGAAGAALLSRRPCSWERLFIL